MKTTIALLALALLLSLAWASSRGENQAQQSLPGYVLRLTVLRDSTESALTLAWATDTLPDSLVLAIFRDNGDSLVAVYRPAPVVPEPASKGK